MSSHTTSDSGSRKAFGQSSMLRASGLLSGAVALSNLAAWAVGATVGYRYWGGKGLVFVNVLVPLAAGVCATAAGFAQRSGVRRSVRGAVMAAVLAVVSVGTHAAAMRWRWIEGYYEMPRGVDVRRMSSEELVAAWLDSPNVELSGSAKLELESRGGAANEAVLARLLGWRRGRGAAYMRAGPVLELAAMVARTGDPRAVPVLVDIAGAQDPACGMDLDPGQRAYYRAERPRVLAILKGVFGIEVGAGECHPAAGNALEH